MILTNGLYSVLSYHRSGSVVEGSQYLDWERRCRVLAGHELLKPVRAFQGKHVAHIITPRGLAVLDRNLLQVEGCRRIKD